VSLSCRRFLLDQEGRLVRLKNTTFERLVRDPLHHTMPAMAGQRVQMAEILVELSNRIPIRVVRRVYFVLTFDGTGRVDTERFRKQQWALAESALDPALALPADDKSVLDAASRFIAHGGRWRPRAALAKLIDDAALGNVA